MIEAPMKLSKSAKRLFDAPGTCPAALGGQVAHSLWLAAMAGAAVEAAAFGMEMPPDFLNPGSRVHISGACTPCAYFHRQRCLQGAECEFCHLCGPEAWRLRRKERFQQRTKPGAGESASPAPPGLGPLSPLASARSEAHPTGSSALGAYGFGHFGEHDEDSSFRRFTTPDERQQRWAEKTQAPKAPAPRVAAPIAPPGLVAAPADCSNPGSAPHGTGNCTPCAYFHRGLCVNGSQCRFCHACGPGERRQRRLEKNQKRKGLVADVPPPSSPTAAAVLALQAKAAIPAAPPGFEEAPAACPNPGSAAHGKGNCKPCAYFHRHLCIRDAHCTFCHLCGPEDEERWRKKEETAVPGGHADEELAAAASDGDGSTSCQSFSEDEAATSPRVEAPVDCANPGSAPHGSGKCTPCGYFHRGLCVNGSDCRFCHVCGPDERRRRRLEKCQQLKLRKGQRGTASSPGSQTAPEPTSP